MADNQQQQSNAFQMAADVARDAKAISKIAAKAATGNVAGAAVDTLLNPQLMKRVLCGILASLFLITCCLYAIPTMIWEAVQNVVATVSATVEDAQEAYDESAALVTYYQQMINEGVDLSDSLEEEQKNCDSLYNKLKAAQSAYATQSISAKKEYQESVFSSQNAGSQYSADVTGVDIKTEDAEADLEDAKEKLAEFESFVGDGTITSEYDGTIMTVGYAAGDDLSSQTAVVTFADASEVTMTVSVSEEDITGISIGDEVIVELNAYEDREFAATVENMDTSVSSGSSTVSYDVEVHLTGDCEGILTDMTGNVTFVSKEVKDVLYVSNKAVIRDGTISYVKVKKEDGTIAKTEVETGFSDGVNVEITSGLEEGDTVLIESQVKSE